MEEKRHVGLNDSNAADLTQQTFLIFSKSALSTHKPVGGEILVV
jgi:hypothetical protein